MTWDIKEFEDYCLESDPTLCEILFIEVMEGRIRPLWWVKGNSITVSKGKEVCWFWCDRMRSASERKKKVGGSWEKGED